MQRIITIITGGWTILNLHKGEINELHHDRLVEARTQLKRFQCEDHLICKSEDDLVQKVDIGNLWEKTRMWQILRQSFGGILNSGISAKTSIYGPCYGRRRPTMQLWLTLLWALKCSGTLTRCYHNNSY